MADTTKVAVKEEPPALADGAAATDPAVHQLLANRDLLARRDNDLRGQIAAAQAEIDANEKAHDAITAQLAELGYR